MRYAINFNKTINQLVPYYLGGRKLILYLQSLMHPLQTLNDMFREWANEVRIDATMTSQIFKFEWYLNRRFGKYLLSPEQRITIVNGESLGVPMYSGEATMEQTGHLLIYSQSENAQDNLILYREREQTIDSSHSFSVYSPAINTNKISQETYLSMLAQCINKYKLSTKTYNIKLQQQ